MVHASLLKGLGILNVEAYVEYFNNNLLKTNKTLDYFVDWEKVKENVEKYKVEIGILSSLVGSKRPKEELRALIKEYPQILPVMPLIVAFRIKIIALADEKDCCKIKNYDFLPFNVTDEKIDRVIEFCEGVGIFQLLENIKVLRDYIMGVEVGLDSNARKNRSGEIMEKNVTKALEKLKGTQVISQKSFGFIEENYKTKIPELLRERRFDFCVRKGNKWINIEVNYYGGGGSKPQEIVDSYIERMKELKEADWEFIWITDGAGWASCKSQITKAIKEMNYVLNLKMLREGYLEKILMGL